MNTSITVIMLAVLLNAFGALSGQPAYLDNPTTARRGQELAAVLKWEILWKESPEKFKVSSGGSARFAMNMNVDSISYCSHDVGVCAMYKVTQYRNWFSVKSVECSDNRSDLDSLISFIGGVPASTSRGSAAGTPKVGGPGGYTGSPTDAGIFWTTTLRLGTRDEIIQEYRKIHPAQLESLETWPRAGPAPNVPTRAATIACFAATDPSIYVYVARGQHGPYVLDIYWDKEGERWMLAFVFEGPKFRDTIQEIRSVVRSIPCATLKIP